MRHFRNRNRYQPIGLSDKQMEMLTVAAQPLNPDQRYSLLLRVEAALKRVHVNRPSDQLLANCIQATLAEVMQ